MFPKKNSRIILAFVLFLFGAISITIRYDLSDAFRIPVIFVTLPSIFLLITGLALFVYIYLQGRLGSKMNLDNATEEEVKNYLDQFADRFIEKMQDSNGNGLDENQIKKLIDDHVNSITDKTLMAKIEEKYGDNIKESFKYSGLFKDFEATKRRLDIETIKISRNSNINLSIGFFTTALAIVILFYSLFDLEAVDARTAIYNFIPRFSLSLFIELFSFFFLRLYKRNLEDIKYFNNEKTNVDLQLIAIKTALLSEDKEMIKSVIEKFASTERNFVLKKGESTIDNQRNANETKTYKAVIKEISEIFKVK